MKLWLPTVVALGAALALAPPATADVATDELAALRTAAKCSDAASVFRPWCIATDFAKGTAADLPKGKHLIGITIELQPGKEADALTNHVSLGALAVSADGKAKVTYITPSNPDEGKQIGEAVFAVAAQLKGKAKAAKLPKDLAGYLVTIQGVHATAKAGDEWTFTGDAAARMRKVGAYWVVIETPLQGPPGIFASIFTDAWE